jgi:putative DNA primase/helicase
MAKNSGKFDTDQIIADNPIQDVVAQYVALEQDGNQWRGLCPFHEDTDPSMEVGTYKGKERFHCYGCGSHGDVITFIQQIHGDIAFRDACEILGGERKADFKPVKRDAKPAVNYYAPYKPLPIPEGEELRPGKVVKAFNPKRAEDPKKHTATYKPSMVFPYCDIAGNLIAYVIRQDLANGGKMTPLLRWCELPGDKQGWCHHVLAEPRPLYGLDRLARGGQVVLVEGEKAADAGMKLLDMPVLSWQGGGKGAKYADWTTLLGRDVAIWPDADDPGLAVAVEIYEELQDIAKTVKIVGVDPEKSKGWDAADALEEGWTGADAIKWMRATRYTVPKTPEPEPTAPETDEPPLAEPVEYADGEAPEPETTPDLVAHREPFRLLGYNQGHYFYLPDGTQQITILTPSGHTRLNLLQLAPLQFWENNYPAKHGVDWDAAANSLIQRSVRNGVFSAQDTVRGRGAWIDDERVVIHTGPKVLENGHAYDPIEFDTCYVYEKSKQLAITKAKPATSQEAHRLVQVCERLTWEHKISGALLAGWCVIAPVCGILDWRPHIWMTGEKGSGKTTVLRDIVKNVVGEIGLSMEGDSTEAGIRQTLGRDARPIIFDEAESESKKDAARLQAVLGLSRKASSGADVVKGSATGEAVIYTVRSIFCFSSINTAITHEADESRITKLVLLKNNSPSRREEWKELQRDLREWITEEFSASLFARTLENIEDLQANCSRFIDAASIALDDQRAADQIGPMLAGYYSLFQKGVISVDDAERFIEEHNWDEHTAISSVADADRCLERLASHKIRAANSATDKAYDMTIGDLIMIAASRRGGKIPQDDADNELRTIGVKVTEVDGEDVFIISNRSTPIDRIYADTPWSTPGARMRQFKTLRGATASKSSLYFSPGIKSRGTVVPVCVLEEV